MKETIYKLPPEFITKLQKVYPLDYQKILSSFLTKKISSFRANFLKTDLLNLRRNLNEEKIQFKELNFPRGAFLLQSSLRQLQKAKLYQEGLIYLQNISSMLPVFALSPQNQEKILDLCAAPGAKTTQISAYAPQAEVMAIEKDLIRYEKLLANLKLQGAENVQAFLMDGLAVNQKFPQYFDKILVDALCSAEGRFYLSEPKSFKYWKQRKVKLLAHQQKRLLYAAFLTLKEKGILVYSTCTFSPEENEEVIDWLINKFKGELEILPLAIPLKNVRPGLVFWQEKKFSPSLSLTLRIIPNDFMEGFYLAKLKKVGKRS